MIVSLVLGVLCVVLQHQLAVAAAADCTVSCVVELQSWGFSDDADQQNGYIKVNGKSYYTSFMNPFEKRFRGVSLMTLDPKTCSASGFVNFDTYVGYGTNLNAYLTSVTTGTIILGVTADEPTTNLQPAIATLLALGLPVGDVGNHGKFAFIFQKGVAGMTQFAKNSAGGKAVQLWTELQSRGVGSGSGGDIDIATQGIQCLIELQSWGFNDVPALRSGFVRVNQQTYFTSNMAKAFRGVNLFILDPVTCTVYGGVNFDTNVGQATDLVNYLNNIKPGIIVLGVTADEPTTNLKPALATLASLGVYVDDIDYRGKFNFVIQKGYPDRTLLAKGFAGNYPAQLTVIPGINWMIATQSWGFEDDANDQNGFIIVEGTKYYTSVMNPSEKRFRGVSLMTLNRDTGVPSQFINFDTYVAGNADLLAAYIKKQAKGTILIGVTADDPMTNIQSALDTLASAGVSVSDVGVRGKFTFILQVGYPRWSAVIKANKGGESVGLVIYPQGYPIVKIASWGFNDDPIYQFGYIRVAGKAYFSSNMAKASRGVNLMTFDPKTLTAINFKNFDTNTGNGASLASYINGLAKGTILLGSTADEPITQLGPALQTLLKAGVDVSDLTYRAKFAFILTIGYPSKTLLVKGQSGGKNIKLTVSTRNLVQQTPPQNFTLVVDDLINNVYADGNEVTATVLTRNVNVGQFVIPGSTGQISIYGRNKPGNCGVIGSDGSGKFVTDNTWRCSNTFVQGWSAPTFDDSKWALATATPQSKVNWLPSTLAGLPLDAKAQMIWTSTCQTNQDVYCRSPRK